MHPCLRGDGETRFRQMWPLGWAHEQLVAFVVAVSERLAGLEAENEKLRAQMAAAQGGGSQELGELLQAALP